MVLMKAVMAVITTVWLKVTCLLSAESISQRRCQYANKCGIEETVRNPLVFLNTVRCEYLGKENVNMQMIEIVRFS